jgi:hypothetical protein
MAKREKTAPRAETVKTLAFLLGNKEKKVGGADRIRTGEYRFCRPLIYGYNISKYRLSKE